MADTVAHGTRRSGERHGLAKLSDALASEIKHTATGNNHEIARRYGVPRETVRDIRNGKRWKHV